MTAQPELPPFEIMYLEIQPRKDQTLPLLDEVLTLFRERNLAGVAVTGSDFGLVTPVVAKIAMTMVEDTAVVFEVDKDGSLRPGTFTGEVCEWLARSLCTDVIADEYVRYFPEMRSGEVEFVELDPRRGSIEQPAGFPNEWRISPQFLNSRGFVWSDGIGSFTPNAIARDCGIEVSSAVVETGRVTQLPRGVVELPTVPHDDARSRVVLFAQAGLAKYAHLVIGRPKRQLRLTIPNVPRFSPAMTAREGSAADSLLALLTNAGLVAGAVDTNHPHFPRHVIALYERLTSYECTHSFFYEVAEALGLPHEFAELAEEALPLPETGSQTHSPHTQPAQKKSWFRR